MNTENQTLYRIQETELEILKYVDDFCRKHNIKYSLSGGTLLGAVRHKGFIPWDDDVDIMMMREDYDRFIQLWLENEQNDDYILQTKELYHDYYQSFGKVRKNHTTFLQYEMEIGRYQTGIFIDIMPADRFPDNKLLQIKYYINVLFFQLFTREFAPPDNGILVNIVSTMILKSVPHSRRLKYRKKILKRLTKYNCNTSLQIISTETLSSMKRHYSSDLMDSVMDIEFEDAKFLCSSKWKEILEVGYGDYLQLPPENEREWRHHPIVIDFEYNYEELV